MGFYSKKTAVWPLSGWLSRFFTSVPSLASGTCSGLHLSWAPETPFIVGTLVSAFGDQNICRGSLVLCMSRRDPVDHSGRRICRGAGLNKAIWEKSRPEAQFTV